MLEEKLYQLIYTKMVFNVENPTSFHSKMQLQWFIFHCYLGLSECNVKHLGVFSVPLGTVGLVLYRLRFFFKEKIPLTELKRGKQHGFSKLKDIERHTTHKTESAVDTKNNDPSWWLNHPTHLKNMRTVKLDHETPGIGVKRKNI